MVSATWVEHVDPAGLMSVAMNSLSSLAEESAAGSVASGAWDSARSDGSSDGPQSFLKYLHESDGLCCRLYNVIGDLLFFEQYQKAFLIVGQSVVCPLEFLPTQKSKTPQLAVEPLCVACQ